MFSPIFTLSPIKEPAPILEELPIFTPFSIIVLGPISTLLFSIDKNYEDLKLEIICRPYLTKKNKFLEFDIYVNNLLNQSVQLINNNQDEKIEILFKAKIAKENEIRIDFSFKNPISPYEVFETPDSRKLGILIKSIKIIPKTI